jgi:predicted site-specific integrase-resolvase
MTLVTIPEAARHAVVHPQTVRRWIREGRLKPYRITYDHNAKIWLDLEQVLIVERNRRHARIVGGLKS